MLPRLFGIGLIAALAIAAVTCKSDPTAAGAGTPVAVQTDLTSINVAVGGSGTFTAWVVDVRTNRLEVPVSFTTCDATIAGVGPDTAFHPVPATSARARVVNPGRAGTSCVVVSSSGLKPDTVTVVVGKAAPTISTSRNIITGPVGSTLNDTARVAGGFGTLTGTITFQLYDSTKATCASGPRYTQAVTISGAGAYHTSPGFVTDQIGTWHWTAAYSGDINNLAASSPCAAEPVTITP